MPDSSALNPDGTRGCIAAIPAKGLRVDDWCRLIDPASHREFRETLHDAQFVPALTPAARSNVERNREARDRLLSRLADALREGTVELRFRAAGTIDNFVPFDETIDLDEVIKRLLYPMHASSFDDVTRGWLEVHVFGRAAPAGQAVAPAPAQPEGRQGWDAEEGEAEQLAFEIAERLAAVRDALPYGCRDRLKEWLAHSDHGKLPGLSTAAQRRFWNRIRERRPDLRGKHRDGRPGGRARKGALDGIEKLWDRLVGADTQLRKSLSEYNKNR